MKNPYIIHESFPGTYKSRYKKEIKQRLNKENLSAVEGAGCFTSIAFLLLCGCKYYM